MVEGRGGLQRAADLLKTVKRPLEGGDREARGVGRRMPRMHTTVFKTVSMCAAVGERGERSPWPPFFFSHNSRCFYNSRCLNVYLCLSEDHS